MPIYIIHMHKFGLLHDGIYDVRSCDDDICIVRKTLDRLGAFFYYTHKKAVNNK